MNRRYVLALLVSLIAPLSAAGTTEAQLDPIGPLGYLSQPFDPIPYLPPPPASGSALEAADLAAYRDALKYVGTERWEQAAADDGVKPADVLRRYRCAIGADLAPEQAPALVRAISRSYKDADASIRAAKTRFARPRPFKGDAPDTPLCLPLTEAQRMNASPSYPSGHGSYGGLWGLMLMELAPDRAPQIMARTLSFTESRIVCRVHYPSDIQAAQLVAAGLYARLQAEPEFRADMAEARREIDAARAAQASPPEGCPQT